MNRGKHVRRPEENEKENWTNPVSEDRTEADDSSLIEPQRLVGIQRQRWMNPFIGPVSY